MNPTDYVLELFNALVVEKNDITALCFTHVARGFVTNFDPTPEQEVILNAEFQPLDMRTLFTPEERASGDLRQLLLKQALHYHEVYGFGLDGNLTVPLASSQVVTLKFVRGITVEELGDKVRELIYANAPVKDVEAVRYIIEKYDLAYDINKIQNNELRILLFRKDSGAAFEDGDDAVRWLCYAATTKPLLIKSKEVIRSVALFANTNDISDFLHVHEVPLAKVFNRHKALLLATKNSSTRNALNRISRYSKKLHVPVRQHISKRFIAEALKDQKFDFVTALRAVSLRDKLKYLNLLAYKKTGQTHDAFTIRNGKVHVEGDRKTYSLFDIGRVERAVLASTSADLSHITKQCVVLLDPLVDYGLPTSRKQTIGQLPYGTTVTANGDKLSSGIYWENGGGARDLDLSTIDQDGNRVGWGSVGSYHDQEVIFSGDVTNAPTGAMEFMTSNTASYGLFVNIYSGEVGAQMELVVGEAGGNNKQWIDNTIIREKHILDSKGVLLGYVNGDSFTVYSGRVDQSIASFEAGAHKSKALAAQGTYDFWTIKKLFDVLGIAYVTEREDGVEYDHDLTYESFSFDKLESLLARKG